MLSFRCVPVPVNKRCRNLIESYAIDVGQIELNIAITKEFEDARLEVLKSDIDPSCITILDGIICTFRFPPCLDNKLMLPCENTCLELLQFFVICYEAIVDHVNDKAVRAHFEGYRCLSPESYFDGYDARYFNGEQCISVPNG